MEMLMWALAALIVFYFIMRFSLYRLFRKRRAKDRLNG
jgi:multisubunit Na+/H+ antiporter MnhF subunit